MRRQTYSGFCIFKRITIFALQNDSQGFPVISSLFTEMEFSILPDGLHFFSYITICYFANVDKIGHNARKGRKQAVQRVFPVGWVHYAPTAKKARTIKIRGN